MADFNGKENVIFQKVPSIPLSVYSCDNQVIGTDPSNPGPDLYSGYTGSLAYPPPPPPHTTSGPLNITNPRYSAMYRNTLLRYSPTEAQQSIGHLACPGSPYHSIRTQQPQQQFIQV